MKASKADMGALDSLMSGSPKPKAMKKPVAEVEIEVGSEAPMDEAPKEPKGDPAELIASIQSQLEELSQLL